MSRIVCYGEVLVDVFPDVEKIGGAPLNVANRLASFRPSQSCLTRRLHQNKTIHERYTQKLGTLY